MQAHFAEQPHLQIVERMVRFLGAGEVAHQQSDAVVLGADARRQGCRVVRRNAEPVHAGVDLQCRAAAPLRTGDKGVPFGQFDHAADHRAHAQFGIGRRGAGDQAVEHIDRGVGRGRAHAAGFRQVSDEVGLAAGARQRFRHRLDAAAIAIGLDDAGAFRRHGAAR